MSNHGPTSISRGWWDFFLVPKLCTLHFLHSTAKRSHETVNLLHSEHETRQMICFFFSIILNFWLQTFFHTKIAAEAMSASFHLMVPLLASNGRKLRHPYTFPTRCYCSYNLGVANRGSLWQYLDGGHEEVNISSSAMFWRISLSSSCCVFSVYYPKIRHTLISTCSVQKKHQEFRTWRDSCAFQFKKTRWLHVTSDFKPFGASFCLNMFLAS